MKSILFINTSPRGAASLSRQVATTLVDGLKAANPGAKLVVRDLAASPLPHIGEDLTSALATPEDQLSEAQRRVIALSDELIDELFAADTVVIASAMINFAITSTLKAWIDHVARARRTFRYSESGHPEGLVTGKKVYVVAASGGLYSSGPGNAFDFQIPYLRHMLGFLGMTDIEVIRVEGVLLGPEVADEAIASATKAATAVARQAMAA